MRPRVHPLERSIVLALMMALCGFLLAIADEATNRDRLTTDPLAELGADPSVQLAARPAPGPLPMALGTAILPANAYPPVRFIESRSAAVTLFLTPEGIARACGVSSRPNGVILACASEEKGIMALPHPCQFPNDPYAVVVCHELAHLNGWTGEHED